MPLATVRKMYEQSHPARTENVDQAGSPSNRLTNSNSAATSKRRAATREHLTESDVAQALLHLIGGLAEIEVARLRGRSKRSRQVFLASLSAAWDVRRSAFIPPKQSVNVLAEPRDRIRTHVFIAAACQEVFDPLRNLGC
jgi:hypothetical protein